MLNNNKSQVFKNIFNEYNRIDQIYVASFSVFHTEVNSDSTLRKFRTHKEQGPNLSKLFTPQGGVK